MGVVSLNTGCGQLGWGCRSRQGGADAARPTASAHLPAAHDAPPQAHCRRLRLQEPALLSFVSHFSHRTGSEGANTST